MIKSMTIKITNSDKFYNINTTTTTTTTNYYYNKKIII